MAIKKNFSGVFDAFLTSMAFLAGVLIILIMLSITMDVILRYFLDRPQFWVGELAEYSLLIITFIGTTWVLKKNGHVTVDVLGQVLKGRLKLIIDLVVCLICLIVCGILIYYGSLVAWDHHQRGIYNPTLLSIPKAPLLAIIPLGSLMLLIQLLRDAYLVIKKLNGCN